MSSLDVNAIVVDVAVIHNFRGGVGGEMVKTYGNSPISLKKSNNSSLSVAIFLTVLKLTAKR